MTDDAVDWLGAKRFSAGSSEEEIQEWMSSLDVLTQ